MSERTKYYYHNDNNEKVFITECQLSSGYFLSGYQQRHCTGFLYYSYFGTGGTTLTPLFLGGKNIVMPEYAGKEVHQTEFINQIKKNPNVGKR